MPPTTLPSGITETPEDTLNRARNMSQAVNETSAQAGANARATGTRETFKVTDVETPAPQVVLPSPSESTAVNQFITDGQSIALNQLEDTSQEEARNEDLMSQISNVFAQQDALPEQEEFFAQQVDLESVRADLAEVNSDIATKSRYYNNKKRRIEEDETLTAARKNARIADIERQEAREIADLEVTAFVRQNKFDSAQAYVDRKVDALTAQSKNRLDALKFFYTENKAQLTKAQDRQYTRMLARENRKLDREERQIEQLENEKLRILQNAQLNGAPLEVLQNIQRAESIDEAMKNAGKFGVDTAAQLAIESQRASINATNALAAQRSGSTTGVGTTINAATDMGLTGTEEDPMLSIIANSAGGRMLTQSEAEPLTNAKRVADGLADLQAVISQTDTDPILGLFQKVNPYNLNSAAIDTAINTLVPQLARGTYGEVGVLTDADMTRYANTLPNLTSTEEQNKAVMALTLRKVRSGFASQIESMAAAGRDVSGYADIYNKFNQQIQDLESQIGIGVPGNDADLDAEFDATFGDTNQSTQQVSNSPGFWKSVGNFFFGE